MNLEEQHADMLDLIKKIVHKEMVEKGMLCLCNDSAVSRAIDVASKSKIDPIIELYIEILLTRPFSDYNKRIAIRLLSDRYDVPYEVLHDTVQELTECEFESEEEREAYINQCLGDYLPYKVHDNDELEGLSCIKCRIPDEE